MIRLALALALLAGPVAAQDVTSSVGGTLRWLDKMTGETADIELAEGPGCSIRSIDHPAG
ncbi:MAG: hypothetical protein U5N10_17335 [Gemmobacter sp.]|nr:hypothetical protein [Gemmobacter sp.]